MRLTLSLLFVLVLGSYSIAQELQMKVQVNTPNKAQLKSDPKVFQTLESQVTEFINSTQWTSVTFNPDERIKGQIQLTISGQEGESTFEAELMIQAQRPVYGTDYETQVFYWVDKDFEFNYKEFQPLRKTMSSFTDNLSSILSYYAYMIIAMDFDTFSELGGNEYFRTAETIANAVPSGVVGSKGWSDNKSSAQNRYTLVNDAFNPSIREARKAMYQYHRLGLDIMYNKPQEGRENITQALRLIQEANRAKSHSTYIFFVTNAKTEELINIYNIADDIEKKRVYAMLLDINPSNANKISVLK